MLEGATAAHMAVMTGDTKVLQRLVFAGANVEARIYIQGPFCKNLTPLHLAVELLNVDVVNVLVSAGANVNSTFHCGCTQSPFGEIRALGSDIRLCVSTLHQVSVAHSSEYNK